MVRLPAVSHVPAREENEPERIQSIQQVVAEILRRLDVHPDIDLSFEVDLRGRPYTVSCRPRERLCQSISLSPREREIVRLVARGLPNKAIAQVLDISLWTVATHLRRVFTKLGVTSRAEMVALALPDCRLGSPLRERQ